MVVHVKATITDYHCLSDRVPNPDVSGLNLKSPMCPILHILLPMAGWNRESWSLLPVYATFIGLDFGWGSQGQHKAKLVDFIFWHIFK